MFGLFAFLAEIGGFPRHGIRETWETRPSLDLEVRVTQPEAEATETKVHPPNGNRVFLTEMDAPPIIIKGS